MDLGGRRVRKGGDVAAGLISDGRQIVRRDRQRRVGEVGRVAEVVAHLGDADGVATCIRTVGRDEPLDAALTILVHLGRRHRPELERWFRDKIGQRP